MERLEVKRIVIVLIVTITGFVLLCGISCLGTHHESTNISNIEFININPNLSADKVYVDVSETLDQIKQTESNIEKLRFYPCRQFKRKIGDVDAYVLIKYNEDKRKNIDFIGNRAVIYISSGKLGVDESTINTYYVNLLDKMLFLEKYMPKSK